MVGGALYGPPMYESEDLRYHTENEYDFNRTDGFETEAFGFYCTRLRTVDTVIFHPAGSFVEFPLTNEIKYIAHIFELDANEVRNGTFIHPRSNLAYGLGPPKGSHADATCHLLKDEHGRPVLCRKESVTCQGVKVCSFSDMVSRKAPHVNASRADIVERLRDDFSTIEDVTSKHLLRQKTVAMKAALDTERCYCNLGDSSILISPQRQKEHDNWLDEVIKQRRGQPLSSTTGNRCPGRMVFERDKKFNPFLRCEFSSKEYKFHRIYYPEFFGVDVEYLEALFKDDRTVLDRVEEEERAGGWGPRVDCRVVANSNSPKTCCPLQHRRGSDGSLERGSLVPLPCKAYFQIYTPNDLAQCPRIAILVTGEHTHPVPLPMDTPCYIERIITDLLHSIDTDLADATPRRFMRHPLVQSKLKVLCPTVQDPTLTDLHVSLSNRDKIRRFIDAVKKEKYPCGTGWEGLQDFKSRQDALAATPLGSREDLYVRYMEEFGTEANSDHNNTEANDDEEDSDSKDGPMRLAICMTPAQSRRFHEAIFIQSDIAFKRTPNYYEFEIVSWHQKTSTSITLARAFLTRQSAMAHRILLHRIDQIVKEDTGCSLQWRHLHSLSLRDETGISMWTTDQHLGQACGIGLYLFDVAQQLQDSDTRNDLHEPHRSIKSLSRDDHLRRILRLCVVHLQRNIKTCKTTEEAKRLMRSLICFRHEDFEGTLKMIKTLGGKHAIAWCDNKVGLILPAMCGEKSFIPEHIWHAGDSNTNLTEVSHADVNREGTGCTLLGACIRGQRFDVTKERTVKSAEEFGVGGYDMPYTDQRRAAKSLRRKQNSRVKALESKDKEIEIAQAHFVLLRGRVTQLFASQHASKERLELEKRNRDASANSSSASRKGKKRKRKEGASEASALPTGDHYDNRVLLAAERNVASATLELEKAQMQMQKAEENLSKLAGYGSGKFTAGISEQLALPALETESELPSDNIGQLLEEDATGVHSDIGLNFDGTDIASTSNELRHEVGHINDRFQPSLPAPHDMQLWLTPSLPFPMANDVPFNLEFDLNPPVASESVPQLRTFHMPVQQSQEPQVFPPINPTICLDTVYCSDDRSGNSEAEAGRVRNPNFNPAYYRRVY